MKDGDIEILDLDFEYKLWKNKLDYYKEENLQLKRRVEVLEKEQASFNFSQDNMQIIENQCIQIESAHNKIKTMEFEMGYYAVDYPISSRHSHYKEHEKIRELMERINDVQQDIIRNIYPLLCFPFNQ